MLPHLQWFDVFVCINLHHLFDQVNQHMLIDSMSFVYQHRKVINPDTTSFLNTVACLIPKLFWCLKSPVWLARALLVEIITCFCPTVQ